MSDSNLRMILSLVDNASPGLKSFMDKLKGLDTALKKTAETFKVFQTNATSVSEGAGKAASGVNALHTALSSANSSLSTAASRLLRLADNSQRAATGLNQATGAMAGAQGAANGLSGRLGDVSNRMREARKHTDDFRGSLSDAVKVWAGFQAQQKVGETVKNASSYEEEITKFKNLNISKNDQQYLIGSADAMVQKNPALSRQQGVRLAFDTQTVYNNAKDAGQAMPVIGTAMYNIGRATGKGYNEDDGATIAKIIQRMGGLGDDERMKKIVGYLEGGQVANQGRVSLGSTFETLKQAKGYNLDLEFMPKLIALQEQIQKTGAGGGQAGTWMQSLWNSASGRGGSANEKLFRERIASGLIDESGVKYNTSGSIDQKNSNLKMVGLDLLKTDPGKYVDEYIVAAMKRDKVDIKDDLKRDQWIDDRFRGNGGDIFKILADPERRASIIKDAASNDRTLKGEDSLKNNLADPKGGFDQFNNAMSDLKVTIGQSLLPLLTPLVKMVNQFIISLTRFAENNQVVTAFAAIGAALSGFAVMMSGALSMLGRFAAIFGIGSGAGSITGALRAFATSGVGAVIRSVMSLGASIGGLPGVIAAAVSLIAGYFLFDGSMANFRMFLDSLVNMFKERWETIKAMASDIGGAIAQAFGLDAAAQALASFWDSATALFNERKDQALEIVSFLVDTVAEWFELSGASAALSSFWNSATELFSTLSEKILTIVDDMLRTVVDQFIFKGAYDNLKSFAVSVKEVFFSMVGDIADACGRIAASVRETFNNAMTSLGLIKKEAGGAGGVIEQGMGYLGKFLPGVGAVNSIRNFLAPGNEPAAAVKPPGPKGLPAPSNPDEPAPATGDESKLAPQGKGNRKKTGGSGGSSGGGRRSQIDPEATEASQAARVEKERITQTLRELEARYAEHKIGVVEMYNAKAAAARDGTREIIAELDRERAALLKDPKRNAGALAKNEANKQIALMKERAQLAEIEAQKAKELDAIRLDALRNEADLESVAQSGIKARLALMDEEFSKKKKLFELNGMMGAAADIEEQRSRAAARLSLQFEKEQMELALAGPKLDQQRAQNAVANGSMTTLEAQQRVIDLRMEEGQIIDGILDKLDDLAAKSKDPALVNQIKSMRVEAEGLKNQFDEVTKTLRGGVQQGIEGALGAITSGKGWKAALKALGQSIFEPINAMVNKNLSEMLTNKLFGQADGTGAGNGVLGKLGQQLFGAGQAKEGVSKFAVKAGESGADMANTALSKLASDGAAASTTALVENATKSTLGATAQQMATMALQSLTTAAQTAAMALQSVGGGAGGGGGGGILGSLFGGGGDAVVGMDGMGDGFTSFFAGLPGFAIGADSIPRDMIAKIHKDEMILPAATASKVRAGLSSGGGGAMVVNNTFNVSGQTSRDTMNQMGNKAADALSRAQRRNG